MNKVAVLDNSDERGVMVHDNSSTLAMIAKAAADPNTDVDKFERLMAMHERLEAKTAKTAYYAALADMKPKLPIIERNGKITINDKNDKTKVIQSTPYALYEDIDEAITPVLSEHGFVLSFKPGNMPDGRVTVTATLAHRAGHQEEGSFALPLDTTGSKNNVQAAGSSMSYAKRYCATLLLNIRTRGLDDDGNSSDMEAFVNDDQMEKIFDIINRGKIDQAAFCKYMGVTLVAEIQRKDFDKAMDALNVKLRTAPKA